MGTSFENGISVSFWAFLENNANIFYLKTGFWKIMPFFGISLWWEPLENNANIFYLKTEFPCFFLGLWWEPHLKTGFPCLFGLFGQSLLFENGISLFLGLWWEPLENNANIFYLKTGFPLFFGLWWQPLESIICRIASHLKTGFPCLFGLFWKIMPISSIWKRDFPFFGLVMGTSGK